MLDDMTKAYTALVKQDGDWWIGWIEEIPGVNAQGKTHDELVANLRSALQEALEMNRNEALAAAKSDFKEELIQV
jgi:predicted RNase H-like HicB family nuclease